MTDSSATPAKTPDELRRDMTRALNALYLAVPAEIARDVSDHVYAYVTTVERERDELRGRPAGGVF